MGQSLPVPYVLLSYITLRSTLCVADMAAHYVLETFHVCGLSDPGTVLPVCPCAAGLFRRHLVR